MTYSSGRTVEQRGLVRDIRGCDDRNMREYWVRDEQCLETAELTGQALDFNKTMIVINKGIVES